MAASTLIYSLTERVGTAPPRESFDLFPRHLSEWSQCGPRDFLSPQVGKGLAADDRHQMTLVRPDDPHTVGLLMALYDDQSDGGVHSPEICLPGGGWEFTWLERIQIAEAVGSAAPFDINRANIKQGEVGMMVCCWFQ